MRTAVAVVALVATGCYTIRYSRRVEKEPTPRSERWQHHAVQGLWDISDPTKLDEICPNGFAQVENEITFKNGFFHWLVQGAVSAIFFAIVPAAGGSGLFQVWTPSTVRVTCQKGGTTLAARPNWKPGEMLVASGGSRKYAVVKLRANAGMDEKMMDLFTDALVAEMRKYRDVTVMSERDILAMLGVERQKQMLGCTDASCLVEIGGALGVDRIVHGSVGRVGGSLVVIMAALDTRKARPATSVSERLKGMSDESYLDALSTLASQLMNEPTAK